MRFSTIVTSSLFRRAPLIPCLAALLFCSAWSRCPKGWACRPKCRGQRLLSVSVYGVGQSTGYITVDLQRRSLRALGPGIWEGLTETSGKWGLLRARISVKEADSLRKLLTKANVRRFRPQSRWFSGLKWKDRPVDVTTPLLVIAWEDRELAFALPPDQLCAHVPRKAKRTYGLLTSVDRYVRSLENRYFARENIIGLSIEDPAVAAFDRESDRVWKKSLPHARGDW